MTENYEFKSYVVELKGKKSHFIEGFISTIDRDSFGDLVEMDAQKQILSQIKSKKITLDIDHDDWFDDNGKQLDKPRSTVPIAKIVKAELRSKGVWVKAQLNSNISKFKEVWGSIEDQFLHSFSIAFYPLKKVTSVIKGVKTTIIKSLELINVTLTGSPVNVNATFKPVMKAYVRLKGDENMTENKEQNQESKTPDVVIDEVIVEDKPKVDNKPEVKIIDPNAETIKALQDQIKGLSDSITAMQDTNKQMSVFLQEKQTQEAEAIKQEEINLNSPLSMIKSLRSRLDGVTTEQARLKAELNKPVFKSIPSGADKLVKLKSKPKNKSMLDLIY